MKFNFTEALQGRSVVFRAAFGVVLMVAVALLDHLTPGQVAFSVFYLLPISYFSWFFRRAAVGVLAALAGAVLWLQSALAKIPASADAFLIYLNGIINLVLFLGGVFLLTEVKALYLRERERSRSDFLTGVDNRRAFHEAITMERERALRNGFPITLAYIDIDNFKHVNDEFDHETGDRLLVTVARELQENVRRVDLVARLGGDEFAILLPNTAEGPARSAVEKLAGRVRRAVERAGWNVTFSIGVVTFPKPQISIDEMIKRADDLMYSVKAAGKNQSAYSRQE